VKKTHDYVHHYSGYWSEGGKCRIRIYQEDGGAPVVICSQLPDNRLGGIWRLRIGAPSWSHLRPEEVGFLVRSRTGERPPPSTVESPSDDHDASRRFKAFPDRARP
jgi:hypothetical protein